MEAEAPLQVGSVTLAVRDLARVAKFYQTVVGLWLAGEGAGAVHLGAGGPAFLHLVHRPDATPDDPAQAGLYHTAFLLPTRADLGAWLMHLRAIGIPLTGSADHLVSEAFYLADPEGNGIEVYADRPRQDWGWVNTADGLRVQMANKPVDAAGLLRAAQAPWAGAPEGTRIGHVHLRVGDAAVARQFYGEVVGMDTTAAGPEAVFMSTGGYHHHLAANSWHSRAAPRRDPGRAGLLEFELEAAARDSESLQDPWGTAVRITARAKDAGRSGTRS